MIIEKDLKLQVDSAGTAKFHVGEAPDARTILNAKNHDINITALRARQFSEKDFDEFDNVEHVQHVAKNSLYNFSEQNKIIIFASTLFLLFNDIKVKNYIMTLLVTIFGGTLKLQSGGISKIGLLAYSIIYGLSLFILVNGIEIIIDKYS